MTIHGNHVETYERIYKGAGTKVEEGCSDDFLLFLPVHGLKGRRKRSRSGLDFHKYQDRPVLGDNVNLSKAAQ